jgi:hypothetical protein
MALHAKYDSSFRFKVNTAHGQRGIRENSVSCRGTTSHWGNSPMRKSISARRNKHLTVGIDERLLARVLQAKDRLNRMNRLFDAIIKDDIRTVKRLLREDAGIAARLVRTPTLYDSGIFHWIYAGDTPLHLAAAGYRVAIVQLLLEAGADANATHNRRRSGPLHYAADGFITGPAWNAERQVETIRCLIERGADIHSQDANGTTPLHRAVRTRCAAAVKTLLHAGTDPTVKNKSGSTAFHLAVQNTGRGGTGAQAAIHAQQEIIRLFLSTGVSANLRDGRGRSVAECVRSLWIRDLLESQGK